MAHPGIDKLGGVLIPPPDWFPVARGGSLGVTAETSSQLIRQVEQGFSFKTILALEARSGIAVARLASVVGIPERTLARRKAYGRLAPRMSRNVCCVSLGCSKMRSSSSKAMFRLPLAG